MKWSLFFDIFVINNLFWYCYQTNNDELYRAKPFRNERTEKAQHIPNMYKPHLQLGEGCAVSAIFKLNKVFILDFHTVMSGARIQKATSFLNPGYSFAIRRSEALLILSFTSQPTNQPVSQSFSQFSQPASQQGEHGLRRGGCLGHMLWLGVCLFLAAFDVGLSKASAEKLISNSKR